jgi:tRNA(Ile)-lysidine synthase
MFTLEKLQQILSSLTQQPQFCIAYSGGQDSHVLLHAMAKLREKNSNFRLRAVHIHHGLSPNADHWAQHCQQVCDQLAIPLTIKKIKLSIAAGDSIEAIAREARYATFGELLMSQENLLTAHTLNDQTETFLLQMLRGSGVKGLSAMPTAKTLGTGFLLRPLLNFTRDELTHYAKSHDLQWIEDETNLELRFNRNFLRHQVIPVVRQRWPEIFTTVARSAAHCAEAAELLDELAAMDLRNAHKNEGYLAIDYLLQLSAARQRNLLRYWIRQQGYIVPNTKHLTEICNNVINADESAAPVFSWDQVEIRRYQNNLCLLPALTAHDVRTIIPWNLQQSLVLPNQLGMLQVITKTGEGIAASIDTQKISVRFRQGGERCRPVGRKETHTLKQLMQDWRIPPWQRDRIPLIFCGEDLAAVVDYCVCENYAAKSNEAGIVIIM